MSNDRLNPFIGRFLKTWAKYLGLGGWTTTWAWATQEGVDRMVGQPAFAVTTYDVSKQEATIRVSQEIPWQTQDRHKQNSLQACLLHELVHLRVSGGEVLLGDLESLLRPYLPETVAHIAYGTIMGVREFYVDAVVGLLLNQEERNAGRSTSSS